MAAIYHVEAGFRLSAKDIGFKKSMRVIIFTILVLATPLLRAEVVTDAAS